jgi:hypothetical protein
MLQQLAAILVCCGSVMFSQNGSASAAEPPGDAGPDLTPYQRPLLPEEIDHTQSVRFSLPGAVIEDLVVAAGLGATDMVGGTETSIAVDPGNPASIVISAFSGSWGAEAPLWTSSDAGATWAKSFSIPSPSPGSEAAGCPCDQTVDFGNGALSLFGAFLGANTGQRSIWTGASSDPSSSAAWEWPVAGGATERTNRSVFSDQPWLIAAHHGADFLYVAYTDYGAAVPANHVAVAQQSTPPSFGAGYDAVVSTSAGTGEIASAAIRIAADPSTDDVYAAWQDDVSLDQRTCARNISFRLSRTRDHGKTWSLNGRATGLLVARHQSDEGRPDDPNQAPTPCRDHVEKFGTVNALLGGSIALAVDPSRGDVYFAYHNRDSRTGNNRLQVTRLSPDRTTGMRIVSSRLVSGNTQAALPALAVADNGTVGLLYDTFDGFVSGYPQFTVHMAQSIDHGGSWTDSAILTFLSPTRDNAWQRQRVLGDYQQLKAVGNTFYGAFPANGAVAGRTLSNIDPFFLRIPAAARQ